MRYLPILQELFESDTIVFLIIGIAIALVIGLLFAGTAAIGFCIGTMLCLLIQLSAGSRGC